MNYLKQLQIIDDQLTNKESNFYIVFLHFFKTIPFMFFIGFLSYSIYLIFFENLYFLSFLFFIFCFYIASALYLIIPSLNLNVLQISKKENELYNKNSFLYTLKMILGFSFFDIFKSLKICLFNDKNNDLNLNEKKDTIIKKIITNKDLLKEIILMKKNKQENEIYKKYIYPLLNKEHNTDLDSQEILALQSLSKNKSINIY